MKNLLESIVKGLVDAPDAVEIKEVGGQSTSILEVHVPQRDCGKIIGKEGKTILAIRHLMMSIAARTGMRVSVEVIEPNKKT